MMNRCAYLYGTYKTRSVSIMLYWYVCPSATVVEVVVRYGKSVDIQLANDNANTKQQLTHTCLQHSNVRVHIITLHDTLSTIHTYYTYIQSVYTLCMHIN